MCGKCELEGDKIQACSICGGPVSFVTNDVIYGATQGDWPYIYLCDDLKCAAYVFCHPKTDKPLGTMADPPTRRARREAHRVFDQLWRGGKMSRRKAYEWLSGQLGMNFVDCHIGNFDVETCERAIRVVKASGFVKESEQ